MTTEAKMLTAQEAKNLKEKHSPSDLQKILNVIEIAAREGKDNVIIYALINSNDQIALKNLGYEVIFVPDWRDGNFYRINWK